MKTSKHAFHCCLALYLTIAFVMVGFKADRGELSQLSPGGLVVALGALAIVAIALAWATAKAFMIAMDDFDGRSR
jgi:hypothetical protein